MTKTSSRGLKSFLLNALLPWSPAQKQQRLAKNCAFSSGTKRGGAWLCIPGQTSQKRWESVNKGHTSITPRLRLSRNPFLLNERWGEKRGRGRRGSLYLCCYCYWGFFFPALCSFSSPVLQISPFSIERIIWNRVCAGTRRTPAAGHLRFNWCATLCVTGKSVIILSLIAMNHRW